ncbi:MAG: GNAT family N-acetyltransferase [Anaerolineales bacterium]|nr:GNAT family N-acetyltransferase [Anaerolineales bacterium]
METAKTNHSIRIRPIQISELGKAKEILDAGYGEAPGRENELKRLSRIQSEGWFFACRGQEPVGIGGAILYDRFAYIGMMAVLPAYQRQGYGRAIFEHILDWLREQGCMTYLLDATPAGAALYRQYHFTELEFARQYICHQPQGQTHPSPKVDLITEDRIPELVAFDQQYFGANRERLLRVYFADYPHRFLVKRDSNGKIRGFLIAQPQRPGPYVACSVEDAADLLEAALTLNFEGEINVIAPAANRYAEDLFQQYGFQFLRALPHMGWGLLPSPCQRQFIYGQTSFALG